MERADVHEVWLLNPERQGCAEADYRSEWWEGQ
jgi:hypothetical protein